uniref:AIG1-type G domain-containing protein n=1 Tax=Sinocyclocheilus rhinocerous TaxID=307959 RepID=A0A673MJS1_9TELE
GNTILGRRAFGVAFSAASATSKSNSHDVTLGGQKITVIDTPGLYDTSMKIEQLKHEIEKLFNHSGDGIHAILLVIKLGAKFTEEERNTVQWIKENFGEDVSKNTIVLFTNGDELEHSGMTIEDYINEGGKLRGLRYISVQNVQLKITIKGLKLSHFVYNFKCGLSSVVCHMTGKFILKVFIYCYFSKIMIFHLLKIVILLYESNHYTV